MSPSAPPAQRVPHVAASAPSPSRGNGRARPARVLHTADVHLHDAELGRCEHAFRRVIDLAIREEVDALLVAGDLFDHARVPDALLDWAAEQLDRLHCPVVLLPGNHDAHHDRSVLARFDPAGRCRRAVYIGAHDGETVEVPGTNLVVWGRAMYEHEPAFQPLAGVPDRPADAWAIVAGHGIFMDRFADPYRSSPIRPEEVGAVEWDYVALGHHHEHRVVRDDDVPAWFAGATAASRKGVAGAVIVDFVPAAGARPRWVELPD